MKFTDRTSSDFEYLETFLCVAESETEAYV